MAGRESHDFWFSQETNKAF